MAPTGSWRTLIGNAGMDRETANDRQCRSERVVNAMEAFSPNYIAVAACPHAAVALDPTRLEALSDFSSFLKVFLSGQFRTAAFSKRAIDGTAAAAPKPAATVARQRTDDIPVARDPCSAGLDTRAAS
jgi:hypothetical protein